MKMDAIRALKGPLKEKNFDYIFLDPPYKERELLNEVLKLIISLDLLEDKGIIIIEENKDYDLAEVISADDFDIDTRTIGLLTSFCEEEGTNYVIRGLRAVSDYEYELQMAMANKSLNKDLETIFLVASHKFNFLSSSIVKEIAYYHGDISALVPENVEIALKKKYERG